MQTIQNLRNISTNFSTKSIFVEINTNFTLRNKPDKNGLYIVYLLITRKGRKEVINTQVKVDKKLWKNQRVLPSHPNAQDTNLILGQIMSKIENVKTQFRLSGHVLTIDRLIENFQKNTPDFDFISFYKHHLFLQPLAPATFKLQKSVLQKLETYRSVLPYYEMDTEFFARFSKYLEIKLKNKPNTVAKNISTIKKYMRLAEKEGYFFGVHSSSIKTKKQQTAIKYLLPEDVRKLKNYLLSEFVNPNHKLPLAYFLLACYTGMRISDIQKLKTHLLEAGTISFNHVKSGNYQMMKLNPEAESILKVVPEFINKTMSDQKINSNLKVIAEICGLRESQLLSMHVGRHTFATTYIRNGGNPIKLQKLLGHSKLETTMIYVHITEFESMEDVEQFITY